MTIPADAPPSYVYFMPTSNRALGDSANQLARFLEQACSRGASQGVNPIMGPADRVTAALLAADAEDLRDLPASSIDNAKAFMRVLSVGGFALPDVVVEQGGSIGFDWTPSQKKVLSVYFDGRGMLGYAALIGHEPIHGKVPFVGAMPETIAHLLTRVRN